MFTTTVLRPLMTAEQSENARRGSGKIDAGSTVADELSTLFNQECTDTNEEHAIRSVDV